MSQFMVFASLVGVSVLAGCVSQMQGMNVTASMPNDRALAYLNDLDVNFNATAHAVGAPRCEYADTAMAGSKVQFLLIGSTANRHGMVAFNQWRVSEIRQGQGMAGGFYTIFVKSPDGAVCTPLRSKAGTPEDVVRPKIEDALTALVSLGVQYNPNALGGGR